MARWPKDNQAALIKFYGDPARDVGGQLVKVKPPFKMYYDGKLLNTISFHKKAAPALLSALNKVWDYYGRDQAKIDKLGISKTAGTYNPRKVRGSATKWSNHAYGAAIDINAEQNGFNVVGNIPLPMIAAFKAEGFSWGGDYKTRPDPMHFEACDRGEPERTFDEWLSELGVMSKPVSLIDQDIAPPSHEEDFAEQEAPTLASVSSPPSAGVRNDPEVWSIQRRLKAIGYNPGEIDGLWGGMTAGAITGFINDRQLSIDPPASVEQFRGVQERLKVEIGKAEIERFTRPIAPERAMATSSELAPKLADVDASIKAERTTFWGSITAALTSIVYGIGKFFGDAVETLRPVKTFVGQFIGSIPWPVWVGGALLVAGALFYASRKSGQAKLVATQAYQQGSRT